MRLISNKTVNLQLIQPTSDEKFELSNWNKNMELIDTAVKNLQDTDEILTPKSNFDSHTNNNNNPHTVTKSQIGLSNVVNTRQMNGLLTEVGNGNVPIFNGNGYTIKDSGFTIEKSVPADANFNDTVYVHPENGMSGIYTKIKVDTNGHVIFGQTPTTLAGYGIIDAEPLGASNTVLVNANKYTDTKIASLEGKNILKKYIVEVLPTENIDSNAIYLVRKENSTENDIYNEYLNFNGTSDGYEWIGNTSSDLSDYYTKFESNNLFIFKSNISQTNINDSNKIPSCSLVHSICTDLQNAIKNKIDIVEGKGLSTHDFSDTYKTRVDEINVNAEANVQSDWNTTDTSSDAYIKNKPSLGTSSTKDIPINGNASTVQVVMGNDSRLSDARPANDVSAWAKANTKPTYTKSEVGLANVENIRQYSPTNPQPSVAKLTTPRTINGVAFDGTANINIETGVTGIKGENEIDYRNGNVNITKANIGLNNVGNFKAVSTVANQGLSDAEKLKARENIGVPTFIFQTEEPTAVPENTIIFVYE